jgi:nucleoside-diphosphate-sugar epimerase
MTDVVTGVAGFIGSRLATRLLADGNEVIGIDCFTDYYDPARKRANVEKLLGNSGFEMLELDLAEVDVTDVVAGAACVYHLAAQPGVRGSWGPGFAPYVRNNIVATQRLLEAMRGSGARIVFASSSSIYGEAEVALTAEDDSPRPVSPYGVTKLSSEQLVMAYRRAAGLDARCVRYFTVYGPGQRPDMAFSRFIGAARRDEAVDLYGDGEQTRDFTFVADAVDATIRAGRVEDPAEAIFNVGGGSNASIREVLAILGQLLGRPVKVRQMPPQAGDVRHTGADLSRARRVLDWHPTVSLADGLRAQVEAASEVA